MRIIAGKNRGLRLKAPSGRDVRPTSDKVREALFQIAESRYGIKWQETVFLDLFAGAGTLGLEALSRGAGHAVFVDSSTRHINTLYGNIHACRAQGECSVIRASIPMKARGVAKVAGHGPFNMIVADPPYSRGLARAAAMQVVDYGLLDTDGLFVIEEFYKESLPGAFKGVNSFLALSDNRRYGQTMLWFYKMNGGEQHV